jgi:hypothetical protein
MIYNIKITNGNRQEVADYIYMKKSQGQFRVVDVGGVYGGWSMNLIDALIDFNDPGATMPSHITHFKCDITNPRDWTSVLEYVGLFGKFDFCICTHTLEDIMNPVFVSEQIANIALAGYVAFPSKYRELAKFQGDYRGYIHHRWIFTAKNNVIIGFPKIGLVENCKAFDSIADFSEHKADLSFYWKDAIEIVYLNNNFLGPDVASVIKYYADLCRYDYL